MSKSSGKQTVVQQPDAASRGYINQMRGYGQGAATAAMGQPGSFFTGPLGAGQIQQAMNPYLQNVMQGMNSLYDNQRQQAMLNANAMATQSGAFGGSKHGAMMGARLAGIDRDQAYQTGQMLNQAYGGAVQLAEHNRQLQERMLQEPLFRNQQALNFLNLGMGPVGTSSVQSGTPGNNPMGSALGGATMGSQFGPWGALVGGGLGLLGGLFG